MTNLFFSHKISHYIMEYNNDKCFFCGKDLLGYANLLKIDTENIELIEYCSNCNSKAVEYAKLNFNRTVSYSNILIQKILPFDALPVFISKVTLKVSRDIGGCASNKKIKEYEDTRTKVVDKTRLANYESVEGAKIGDHSKINDILIAKNEALQVEGVKGYLEQFNEIEHKEKRLIDRKSVV